MKVKFICRKFECRKDIHYKIQTGTSCENCNSKAKAMYIFTTLGFPTYNFDFHADTSRLYTWTSGCMFLDTHWPLKLLKKYLLFYSKKYWQLGRQRKYCKLTETCIQNNTVFLRLNYCQYGKQNKYCKLTETVFWKSLYLYFHINVKKIFTVSSCDLITSHSILAARTIICQSQ